MNRNIPQAIELRVANGRPPVLNNTESIQIMIESPHTSRINQKCDAKDMVGEWVTTDWRVKRGDLTEELVGKDFIAAHGVDIHGSHHMYARMYVCSHHMYICSHHTYVCSHHMYICSHHTYVVTICIYVVTICM